MISISSKFGLKKYVHNKEVISFRRIHGGVCGKTAVILGEDHFDGETNYFLLAEIHGKNIKGLVNNIQELIIRHRKKIRVDEWFSRLNSETEQLLIQHNTKAFHQRKPQVFFVEAPGEGDRMVYQVETIHDQLKPKHLYLFDESRVPAALTSLPSDYSKLKAEDFPTVSALGYALTSLVDFPFCDTGDIVLPYSIYS